MRGMLGYGAASRLHSAKLLRLSLDLPVVVELVDREERIRAFLPTIDALVEDGLVTLEPVHVLRYRPGPDRGVSAG